MNELSSSWESLIEFIDEKTAGKITTEDEKTIETLNQKISSFTEKQRPKIEWCTPIITSFSLTNTIKQNLYDTIYFVDIDNSINLLKQLKIKASDYIICVARKWTISKSLSKFLKKNPNSINFETHTTVKEASDISIAMLSMSLHCNLPLYIRFNFVTCDNFAKEICATLIGRETYIISKTGYFKYN